MRLDLPDPATPTRTVSFDYPDAPIVALLTWLLAVPIWQRSPQRISERLSDFRIELAACRAAAQMVPPSPSAAPAAADTKIGAPTASAHVCPDCGQSYKLAMHLARHRTAKHPAAV